jgi:hypothetical protein
MTSEEPMSVSDAILRLASALNSHRLKLAARARPGEEPEDPFGDLLAICREIQQGALKRKERRADDAHERAGQATLDAVDRLCTANASGDDTGIVDAIDRVAVGRLVGLYLSPRADGSQS